jgi:hypothetical protein
MTLVRIAMVGVAIAVMMVVARDQRWAERAGIVGVCAAMPPPNGGQRDDSWYACEQGILNGFPNLKADYCSEQGISAKREIWRCTVPLSSLPGA